jgi:ribonucleoside-triphosphate reductase
MRERLSDYQEQYGDLYNLEATPAESTAYRLAKHDVARYPDIKTAAGDCGTPYYTNSSHLPVGYTDDIFSALDVQDELQTLYTSGTVFHAFLGEKLSDWKSAATLVRKIADNYRLPYYTLSPTYSVCRQHGYIAGEEYKCPKCGGATEVYSRITGYYRPVQNWNDGKTQEFKDRKVYNIGTSRLTHTGPVDCCGSEPLFEVYPDAPAAPVAEEKPAAILYATETCPNCKLAAAWLEKAGIPFEKRFVSEHKDEANALGLKQAPTLVVEEAGDTKIYAGVAAVKGYIDSLK